MGTGARASKALPSWDEGWTVQKVEWLVGEQNFGVEMFSDEPVGQCPAQDQTAAEHMVPWAREVGEGGKSRDWACSAVTPSSLH